MAKRWRAVKLPHRFRRPSWDLPGILGVGPLAKKKPPPPFDPELLDALAADLKTPAELDALLRQMKKALVERALGAELTQHLGYAPGEPKPTGRANHRNGTTPKTVLTDTDRLPLDIPRDRAGSFAPQLVPTGSGACRVSIRRCARSGAIWRSSTRSPSRPTSSAGSPMRCWRKSPPGYARLQQRPRRALLSRGGAQCAAGQDPLGRGPGLKRGHAALRAVITRPA